MADFAGGAEAGNAAGGDGSQASDLEFSSAGLSSTPGGQSASPVPNSEPVSQPRISTPLGAAHQPSAPVSTTATGSVAPNSILSSFKAAGYDVGGFQDDQSFLKAMNDRFEAAERYQQEIAQYQRALAARAQAQVAPQAATPQAIDNVIDQLSQPLEAQPGWNPPAYDTRNDPLFQFDQQTQQWVPNQPNVPYELVQAKNAYMQYRQDFVKEWQDNPIDTIWKRTESRNRALIREELKGLFDQMKVTKDTNDWLEKNKHVLFVDGQIDHTGDPAKLTPAGLLALQATEELDKAGVTDANARRVFTEKYIAAELSKQYFQEQAANQNDPAKRLYSLEEITQALRVAQGLPPVSNQPPQSPSAALAPTQGSLQTPDQQVSPQFAQPAMPPQMVPQPSQAPGYVMTPQGMMPVPPGYAAMPYAPQMPVPMQAPLPPNMQATFVPPQPMPPMAPQSFAQPFPQQPLVPQQGYLPQQQMPPMTPEQAQQMNDAQKRKFLGGVGHSSSAGVTSGPSGEFAPQPSSGGRPNFLGIASQIAAARGIPL